MPTANHRLVVDLLNVIAYINALYLIDDASFFDPLDKGETSAIVCDR